MGLDMNIVAAHNKKEVESDGFWTNLPDYTDIEVNSESYEYDRPAILAYWRKFWPLHTFLATKYHLDNGEWTELTKDDLEEILTFITHNTDYFDSFNSVPQVCKILYYYDTLQENGLSLFYEGDY